MKLLEKATIFSSMKKFQKVLLENYGKKVSSGKSWQGVIKLKGSEGKYFWVDSLISPSYMNDEMIGFLLIKRKASSKQIEEAQNLHKKMNEENGEG